jgi:methionine-S-sulfoxide reductase
METQIKEAYFAGGCFWGVEYQFRKLNGVLDVISGFMGGESQEPSYIEVKTGLTGHLETVKVIYDPSKIDYASLCKLFFEIHDFTQIGGQGPDIGDQYSSAIFYNNEDEKKIILDLIEGLTQKGYEVVTEVTPTLIFWDAEAYHQNYYNRKGTEPYCHSRTLIF